MSNTGGIRQGRIYGTIINTWAGSGACTSHPQPPYFLPFLVRQLPSATTNFVPFSVTKNGIAMKWFPFLLLLASAYALAQVPIPSAPADGSTGLDPTVTLQWRTAGYRSYEVELYALDNPLDVRVLLAYGSSVTASDLDWATTYVWMVRGVTDTLPGVWSAPQRFTVMPHDGRPEPVTPAHNAEGVPVTTYLSWLHDASGPYEVQIDTIDLDDTTPVLSSTDRAVSVPLLPGKSYHWRVRRQSSAAPSPWSRTTVFTTAQQPLPPLRTPTLLAPSDGSTLHVFAPAFSWAPVPEAEAYQLQILDASNPDTALIEWIGSDTDAHILIPPGYTALVWRVQARHASRTSAWSVPFAFALVDSSDATVSVPVPLTPLNNHVLHPVEGGIELTWQHDDGTMPCMVEVVWTHVAGHDTLRFHSATRATHLPDTITTGSITWRVKATPWWAESDWSAPQRFAIVPRPLELPAAVRLLSPPNNAVDVPRTPVLMWQNVDMATDYHVELSSNEDFSTTIHQPWSSTSYRTDTLDSLTRYWWRARASNAAGLGEWSEPFSFVTGGGTTSVLHSTRDEAWHAWPNPTHGSALTVQATEDINHSTTISLVTVAGERIATIALSPSQQRVVIPTADLPAGLYAVVIHNGSTLRALPIVITGAQR